jgi:hypothetical protein
MPELTHWLQLLTSAGVMLAKFFGSPLGTPFGVIVPVGSGIQALVDRFSGKVKPRRLPDTNDPASDGRREPVRIRILRLWWAQVVIAILSAVLIFWLYVADEIPKVGTPPVAAPSPLQSVGLILLMILTFVALALGLARAKTTFGLEKLN